MYRLCEHQTQCPGTCIVAPFQQISVAVSPLIIAFITATQHGNSKPIG